MTGEEAYGTKQRTVSGSEDDQKQELVDALRRARDEVRATPAPPRVLPAYVMPEGSSSTRARDAALAHVEGAPPVSPDRSFLNERFDLRAALDAPPASALSRALRPVRSVLRRVLRFALGPLVERQTELNSAQVRFDNELVSYVDARFDRLSSHYDHVLGLHGKRMEEIDERHLILQQELIRHVHELVKRIELVFESAGENHAYLDGVLREVKEEIRALAARLPR